MSTIIHRPDLYPVGTSVSAYAVNPTPPGGPKGAAVETQTVAGDGSLTFLSLTPGTAFVLKDAGGRLLQIRASDLDANVPLVQSSVGLNTPFTNTYGRPISVTAAVGVICDPGDNGHMYLDVDRSDFQVFNRQDFLACRNLMTGTGLAGTIGNGGNLKGIVPTGWIWQITTEVIAGAPDFITIDAPLPALTIAYA